MNKAYLIAPLILLVAFGFIYSSAVKEMDAKAERQKMEKAAKDKVEADRKAEVERKATLDAQKRQAQREADDKAKEEKKLKEYNDALTKLKDEANDYAAQADKFTKEAADLDAQIAAARTNREKLNRDNLDLSKQVELAKISRRNAELELQRMVEMVAKKLSDNAIATPPPPPLAPPVK